MKKTLLLLVALLILALLSSCATPSKGLVVKYDISGSVENLDPLFATDSDARMIIGNIFEGLVVQRADGEIVPGAASSYTSSEDGLTYTFTLRENLTWSDGEPLNAADFVFPFVRMFNPDAPSPYASDFHCIQGAVAIQNGLLPASALGVAAPDEQTVIFTLERENPFFLQLLASTPAAPCNREFFLETRGRYGLDRKFLRSNGPFRLSSWDNERMIQLVQNDTYLSDSQTLAAGVNLYIGRSDLTGRFISGNSHLITVPYDQIPEIRRHATLLDFDKTTWCIVFNLSDPVVGNPLIRQGLAHALDRDSLAGELAPNYKATGVFIPPALSLIDQPYRELAGDLSPLPYDSQRAAYLYELGLNSLELNEHPKLTLLIPQEDAHEEYMGAVQQNWQKHLGTLVNLEPVPSGQLMQYLQGGHGQMLLIPFSPASGRIDSLLGSFSSASTQNYTGYRNPRYDALLQSAIARYSITQALEEYKQAEQILLSDVVVLPVYFETTTYAISNDITGIEVSPFSGRIYFKYAEKVA